MPSELWTEKYFPRNLTEFIGNTDLVEKAIAWSREWKQGKKKKPLLFFGPTGIGKTALAYLIARINSWGIFELNASDSRTKEIIEKVAGAAAFNASFSGELRLVLLDEVDGLQRQDRGGVGAITGIIRESNNPIILTANDIYADRKLLPLRSYCELMQFKRINYLSIAKRLREILEEEKIEFNPEAVTLLAKNSKGDFRSVLIDLQTLSLKGRIEIKGVEELGGREREEDIFKILRKTFTADNFADARNARFSADISTELLERWIEENIPRHFTFPEDTANAFERLSKADIFNGRIMKRQHYGFLRYSSDLMTAGVSLSRKKDYPGFVMYQFPKLLSMLSRTASSRRMRKELTEKMSEKIHSSSREILAEDFPFLKIILQNNKEFLIQFSAQFDLSTEEIAFLIGSKAETKKVKEIHEKAIEEKKKIISTKRRPLEGLDEYMAKRIEKTDKEGKREEEKEPMQTSLGSYLG